MTPFTSPDQRQVAQIAIIIGGGFIGLLLFFIPSMIAFERAHHQRIAILATNILLGWSGLGWIVAFIWSLTEVRKRSDD